ncbi:xylanase [Nitzschia inconspicua]|uniref:endo-1,4-beta-xylanase n=1 Tax=Nitzschia inconspicua TaxID=303405 RepID=A0A9K3KZN3_9STRA|nr:xylanase [Nitzschia inconspicua]
MYEDGIDGDSLKEVVAKGIKYIDIGAAVLPKPLFRPDVDEVDDDDLLENIPNEPADSVRDGIYRSSTSSIFTNTLDPLVASTSSREAGAPDEFDIAPKIPTRYARTLRHEFNAVVVEHHLKWAPLCVETNIAGPAQEPRRLGRYDFHHADAIVDWAIKHNMKVKGHVLVWHVTSPTEILEEMTPEQVREQLRRHIFTTMAHFRGRIKVWDVVNEALAPDGSLAENIFYRKLGPGYIEECFRWAHEADPDAMLLYNDNKVEGMNGPNKRKADAFFHLLAGLVKNGVPIHGCGIQAHFNAAGTGRNRPPTPRMVKNQIHRLGNLGLKVNISEMDVRVSQLPPNLRQIAQRQIYHDIVAAALTEPAFDGIWLWGFTDRHTWVTHFYYDDEPLIFDEEYGRKEAYYGLRDALSSIVPGEKFGAGVLLDTDEDEQGNCWGHQWIQEPVEDCLDASFSKPENDGVVGADRPDWELT